MNRGHLEVSFVIKVHFLIVKIQSYYTLV